MPEAPAMIRALLLALAWLLAMPDPAPAQSPREAARAAELDRLFAALQAAEDSGGAQILETRIRSLWAQAVSPAAALLLRRGQRNLQAEEVAEALEDFDAALVLEPEAAEAWLMRAQANARQGDRIAAARDLQAALRLEPRHFGALLQLSGLQEEAGDFRGALRSLDAVLALHPKLAGGPERRRELLRRAEGDAL
ncbi:tetratricopeptide repeat protein [Falsiroseomonas selenitidurans]|nr:hypothetical protein [Falsiroseomonas selenitidurans]